MSSGGAASTFVTAGVVEDMAVEMDDSSSVGFGFCRFGSGEVGADGVLSIEGVLGLWLWCW